MPEEPQIKHLSYKKRQRFFFVLVLIFCISLPALIFHTTGYRLDFSNEENTIVSTGGIFITTDNLEVEVYLDEEKIDKPRLFRSAYYVQNVAEGKHQVVVQSPSLNTWVKELPVYPHLVVEAAAFNMPSIPTLRPVTEYVTATGTAVYAGLASTSDIFVGVTTTEPYVFVKSIKPTLYEKNEEYVYVKSLFSSSSVSSRTVLERIIEEAEKFGFATTSLEGAGATSTKEIVEEGDVRLIEYDNELYARWMGEPQSIPFYFCVIDDLASSTAELYGDHVASAIEQYRTSTTTPLIIEDNRVCRPEIRIDRKWQNVYYYDFFPGNSDLVLLHLNEGLYVTEIDDRAWQNTQLLYSGEDFRVIVENDIIYIEDGELYFEIITELEME